MIDSTSLFSRGNPSATEPLSRRSFIETQTRKASAQMEPRDEINLSATARMRLDQAEAGRDVLRMLQGKHGKSTTTAERKTQPFSPFSFSEPFSAGLSNESGTVDLSRVDPDDLFQTINARENGIRSLKEFEAHIYEMFHDAYKDAWKSPAHAAFAEAVRNRTLTVIPWEKASDEMRAAVTISKAWYTPTSERSNTGYDQEKLWAAGTQKFTMASIDTFYGSVFICYGGSKD